MSLSALATAMLIPPVNLLPIAIGGLVLTRWRRRLGTAVAGTALALTWILSTGTVSGWLIYSLEVGLPRPDPILPEAIVILAAESQQGLNGGLIPGMDVGTLTLERLRGGARLARQTRLPVLTSGGLGEQGRPSLAELMATALRRDFATDTLWRESNSTDTWENAQFSAGILKKEDIKVIYLVTHAWHMRRSVMAFRHAGLTVIPAPLRLQIAPKFELNDLLPGPTSWMRSYFAIHEWIGCAVYALRIRLSGW